MPRLAGLVGEQAPCFQVVKRGRVGALVADVSGLHDGLMVEGIGEAGGIPLEKQRPIQADVVRRSGGLAAKQLVSDASMTDVVHSLLIAVSC